MTTGVSCIMQFRDCGDILNLLTSDYQFDRQNVITLYNNMATRENILETFENLQDQPHG